jgi:enamine deaminase RidA (YjgF/YER057c/UK114 family)
METKMFACAAVPVRVSWARFAGRDGVAEIHFVLRPEQYAPVETQLAWLQRGYQEALAGAGVPPASAVFRRFFCSDVINHAAALDAAPFADPRRPDTPCAIARVGQAPLAPAKVALWAYHVCDPAGPLRKSQTDTTLILQRGALTHYWTAGLVCPDAPTSQAQTQHILEQYRAHLAAHRMTLADNVLRTWFFVQNIDANYHGLVVARREFFAQHGLTKDTHFIASTGVEGSHADARASVIMDAHAIAGVQPAQIRFLAAPEHLSPTYVYGVTFERGTAIAYRDRTHVLISGTASIDARGEILHVGDVARQLDRTLENIAALLRTAGADFEHVCVFLVYARDAHDLTIIQQRLAAQFPALPTVLLRANVCRPGWLVEIEALAITGAGKAALPPF